MKEDVEMKLREKKKITLREYHKKRMLMSITLFIAEIFENIIELNKLDEKMWASVIFIILAVLSTVFAVLWLYASFQNVDKEDELARENMLKAHDNISTTFLLMMAAVVMLSLFWNGSITFKINGDNLYKYWMVIWFSYMTLESGFFLHHEGKLSTDEEDE